MTLEVYFPAAGGAEAPDPEAPFAAIERELLSLLGAEDVSDE